MAKLFDGVRYALSDTLEEKLQMQLATLLNANGATPALPSDQKLTHYVSNTLPGSQPIDALPEETDAHVVTSLWVERSAILAARQEEIGFSPDPALIFSGVIAAACDLSNQDLEILSAGISALGGQWRTALTKEVTHLFALSTGSAKYETGIHFKSAMNLAVVVPHWFDDCVRLGQRIQEEPYEWPEPKVFEATWGEHADNEKPRSPYKVSPEKSAVYASVFQKGELPSPQNVWKGLKIMLSLEMTKSQRAAHEADIAREGGVIVHGEDVEAADILITRYRSGPIFVQAYRLNKTIATLAWLWYVRSTGIMSRPTEQLLHYPIPYRPIEGFSAHHITVTNYTGADREYLKKLIVLLGAQFTADMTGNNTVVIAATMDGKKTKKAVSWSIPVVNHTWLEDCLIQWRHISLAQDKYTYFPPGVDFGKLLAKKGLGRSGYDPSELELIEKEVIAEENSSVVREEAPPEPIATGQSAREVEDVVMDDGGDKSMGAYLDRDIEMDVDGEEKIGGVKGKKSLRKPSSSRMKPSSSKPKSSTSKPRSARAAPIDSDHGGEDTIDTAPPSKPTRKPLRRRSQHALVSEPDDEPESEASPTKSPSKRSSSKGKRRQRDADAEQDEEDEEVEALPAKAKSRVSQAMKKKIVLHDDDAEMDDAEDAIEPKPRGRPSVKRTYGSAKKPPATDKTDTEEEETPSQSKTSLHTPKRTLSVLVPTYEQVRSASKKSPSKSTRTESIRMQAHEVATGSPKRGRPLNGSAKATRSKATSLSPSSPSPPPTRRRKAASNARRPTTPEPGPSKAALTPTSVARTPSQRLASNKASQKLRDEVVPDLQKYAKQLKRGEIPDRREETESWAGRSLSPPPANPAKARRRSVAETPVSVPSERAQTPPTLARSPSKRSAATKATQKLRDVVMPDMNNFQKELRRGSIRSSWDHAEEAKKTKEAEKEKRRKGKKRVSMGDDEEQSDADEDEQPDRKKRRTSGAGAKSTERGKGSVKATGVEDEDEDEEPVIERPKPSKPRKSNTKTPVSDEYSGKISQRDPASIKIMTTQVSLSEDVQKTMTKLGVKFTVKPTECTHLVTRSIVRTEKFLCAMAVAPIILTEKWIETCVNTKHILVEDDFLLSDPSSEKKYNFSLPEALERATASKGKLFAGMTFLLTPKVPVDSKLLKNVVMAGGGQVVPNSTPSHRMLKSKNKYVVSCPTDVSIWRSLSQQGCPIYSQELILNAALRQEIDWDDPGHKVEGSY